MSRLKGDLSATTSALLRAKTPALLRATAMDMGSEDEEAEEPGDEWSEGKEFDDGLCSGSESDVVSGWSLRSTKKSFEDDASTITGGHNIG